jgi:hypothetical protein
MRPVREIGATEENFHVVGIAQGVRFGVIRRDPVEVEPVGAIVLMAFRVAGYEPDLDGSMMARLEAIDKDGEATGWTPKRIGLCHDVGLVVTAEELKAMFVKASAEG